MHAYGEVEVLAWNNRADLVEFLTRSSFKNHPNGVLKAKREQRYFLPHVVRTGAQLRRRSRCQRRGDLISAYSFGFPAQIIQAAHPSRASGLISSLFGMD